MLKQLHIENYAIIDSITIDFEQGFNVFTGETGAGKSIIIGALSLLFGARADSGIIGNKSDYCIIEGLFLPNEKMLNSLHEIGIDCEENYLIIRRTISKNGGIIRVNEKAVTLSFLQKLFADEADIHCQHDNQYLLKANNQLLLLDKYALDYGDIEEYQKAYNHYQITLNSYNETINKDYNPEEFDYWCYCRRELEDANLKEGEEEELLKIERRLKEKDKLLESINLAVNIYQNEGGVSDQLFEVINALKVKNSELDDVATKIKDHIYLLDEEFNKLIALKNSFDDDNYDLDTISERLYLLARLKRKYNSSEKGLIDKLSNLNKRIEDYNSKDEIIDKLHKQLEDKRAYSIKIAEKLHIKRQKAAKILEKEVSQELNDLLLPNAQFKIMLSETDLNEKGNDAVNFYISLNKSQDLKPFNKIASGGELSRLMLGLKTIFSKLSGQSIAIFDEIDTGLSGQAALAVGLKMHAISLNCQVLCITHLASVAASGDHNYYIYKEDINNKTITKVKRLNTEEKIKELARINGTDNSTHGLDAAKELLAKVKALSNENK